MSQNQVFADWKEREATAEAMVPVIGRLYRDRNVETSVYGRLIVKRSVIDILKAHRYARQVEASELSVLDTYPVIEALDTLNLNSAHVDIGKLAVKFRTEGNGRSMKAFLEEELDSVIGKEEHQGTDVVLYGFGRIGRLLARLLIERTGGGQSLRLRAIVVRKGKASNDLEKRASLLRRDSVHGSFKGTIQIDEERNVLIANGNEIQVIFSDGPDQVDYTQYGIDNALVIDNTGIWRDKDGLALHLKSKGVQRVLLTAPGKGVKNIVMGVNHHDITPDDNILSAASCTTNAITPILKAVNDEYGVENGHVETVHSYTNDQNLIDNYHKGDRRGRAAGLNMVITETGAAKAVSKALPVMEGKLTGNAIRVPTPNVSMAILNLNLGKEVERESLNDYLRTMALHSPLQKQIDYSNSPEAVSTDFVGSRAAGVVDALATIATGNRCVLYVWYDNEFGYSCQVLRMAQFMSNVTLPAFPKASK
ncbi:glyceraldehyde-3-phosphate dehydrogenase [Neptunomonas phycophila]|uniref:Glyceraldehyde-3-phosphate dehydrogenase n=1 Tax=Neptunomonas phycophila TaxID=1572645 RepID=A0AAW7XD41_9GAMM|nr:MULTISPECIES: glyceraldehyde-3-phosphate dehydrogenase [Neptunomonas]MBT3146264.1 glyceraldehyde-3-phosphate dehydrogenase [Neptunomonas phycophila]MDN2659560.1 glyceraldehyde-3-phosphate dehydrogenase [Neptunomonas sp. CHC150]MDO6452102.1 glyceraldehyde-3-phosphate dehydrogenase [Neptunomonas phycophila]MDO6466655.1 glyceraldehyde-3-phosphate dehydrogenase [Neptunomonas phycophila]MDO6783067.1 glyceraldehyde-3-phosphate dehydrogenase [Neptunomonas phycophila]